MRLPLLPGFPSQITNRRDRRLQLCHHPILDQDGPLLSYHLSNGVDTSSFSTLLVS